MKYIIHYLNFLQRFGVSIVNLGLFNSFKIVFLKFFPDKKISKISSKKFGHIHWRSYYDYGVISHFFFPQVGFVTKNDPPKVIFDVGANIGIESLRFIKLFPNSKLIAIEPELSNFKLLEKNLKNYKNCIIVNKAVWNKKSNLSIINHSEKNSQTFFVQEKNLPEKQKVESLSLKNLIDDFKISTIDILKIDAEGSEEMIFDETCDEWISLVKVIIVECPDNDAKYSTMKIFNAFERNKIKFKTFVNGENLIFISENCEWTPKKITYY